ncbi:unnamed protein product [Meganyctiphanes norvegica]|uniref:Transmembrane protein n=1 Tax=Meganyctiphanes norvegica TaxID=48144 RepID=A0AAV2RL08_MEGNR
MVHLITNMNQQILLSSAGKMFGNALFHPSNTPSPGRRYSHLDVSLAPKISQRRSTAPFIDVAGMSPGLGTMMGDYNGGRPSTPCFVTPTLGGFSGRRFSYDSPMQTLTAFSRGGLPTVNRKAAKRAWARMNTKKWSRPCKMVTILLLITFAVTLFLVRKMKERPLHMQHESCNDDTGTCQVPDAHIHENDPKGEH